MDNLFNRDTNVKDANTFLLIKELMLRKDENSDSLFKINLIKSTEDEGAPLQVEQTFEQLVDYVGYHFNYEEQLMEQISYTNLDEHKKVHKKLRKTVNKYLIKYKKSSDAQKNSVATDLARFLYDWLQGHIMKEDQKYKPFIPEPNIKDGFFKVIIAKLMN